LLLFPARRSSDVPDLADVVEQAGGVDGLDLLGTETQPLGEEDRVAGDILGVPLRVAVLRVDREDETLEDVEAAGGRRALGLLGRRRPYGVAATDLGLLEGRGD